MQTICEEIQCRCTVQYYDNHSRSRSSRCRSTKVKGKLFSWHIPSWTDHLQGNLSFIFDFRQKALKALDDRMKTKEPNTEAWPELEESHLPVPSTVTINMNEPNELTPSITKEESNWTHWSEHTTTNLIDTMTFIRFFLNKFGNFFEYFLSFE